MDQNRDQLREVEQARQRVAQDVRSVAENANVVERAKENVQGKVDDAKSAMSDQVRTARDKLADARDTMSTSMQSMRENIGNMNPMENPIGMLLAGLAVGFLIGLVLPVTRFEAERIGPMTEDMKDRVRQAGTEVVRRGGEVIKDTIDAGRDAAATSLKEQTRDITTGGTADSLQ
jgi:ElaB/YqjD/DUF883 family membrane-anchored ribosome-binding protein